MIRWRYWADFFMFPAAVVLTAAATARSLYWLAIAAIGFLLWTFVEYWVHRGVLHRWFWHGTHERHHLEPEEFVENIWWYTPALFVVLWFVFPPSLWAGFAAGYVWFLTMHHRLHHVRLWPGSRLYSRAKWHGLHHKYANCNYGITTSVWDVVFRTSEKIR